MPTPHLTSLETPIEGLLSAPTSRLPFQANMLVRSFLLERPAGNVLVYNSPGLSEAAESIRDHGGATRLLINHGHESMYGQPDFAVPVYVHERDRQETASTMRITGTFTDRELIDDDLEVVPTPGHTPGTTSYLWDNGSHRFLFTGDWINIEEGEWKAVVLGSSSRKNYLDSLALVRDLDFDVLVPWAASDEGPCYAVVDEAERRARLDSIIDRVAAGGTT